jgi:hypothetical protein
MRLRAYLFPLFVATAGALLIAWDGLLTPAFSDYEVEAEPAFDLLRAGHLHAFLSHAPSYGGSLVLRAPFVFATTLWHGGSDAAFRAAAVPAIVASIVMALYLFGRLRGGSAWLALLVCAANPLTLASYEIGHAEEVLGAMLCAGAVFAALRDRPIWAGVLIGTAMANKPWAVLAFLPVVLALDHGRLKTLLVAGAIGIAVEAPLLLAGGHSIGAAAAAAHHVGTIFQPSQLWWFLGAHGHHIHGVIADHPGFRFPPAWIETVAHPIVILAGLVLSGLWWRLRRRGADRADALGLLALVLLARCALDPWNVIYYELPFVIALLAWEVELGRTPFASLTASIVIWATFEPTVGQFSADVRSVMFLVWGLPTLAAIGLRVYSPRRFAALTLPVADALRRQMPSLARVLAPAREAHPA